MTLRRAFATLAAVLGALQMFVPVAAQAGDDPHDPASRPPLHSAGAEDPPRAKDLLYDGNYTSFLAGLALPRLDNALAGLERQGAGVALGGRFSVITQFMDVALLLEHGRWGGGSAALRRSDLGATVSIHPAFPVVVFNTWSYDVLSGLHVFIGGSLARIALDGSQALAATGETGSSSTDWRPGINIGVGSDIPISPRNRHSGWWLTARYELRWARFGSAVPDWNLGDSQLLVLIGYRTYDNGWARLPRPF
jgi:hypothetical protein